MAEGPDADMRGPTAAQLRHDIDTGRAGDKVGGFDPAAAPMETDAEAGGVQEDPAVIALDRATQCLDKPNTAHANAATPEMPPDGCPPRSSYALPILAGLLGALILGAGILVQL